MEEVVELFIILAGFWGFGVAMRMESGYTVVMTGLVTSHNEDGVGCTSLEDGAGHPLLGGWSRPLKLGGRSRLYSGGWSRPPLTRRMEPVTQASRMEPATQPMRTDHLRPHHYILNILAC